MERILEEQARRSRPAGPGSAQDAQFHAAIGAAAHNRAITRIAHAIMDLLTQSREESLNTPGRPTRSHEDHRRVLAADPRRDAGARARRCSSTSRPWRRWCSAPTPASGRGGRRALDRDHAPRILRSTMKARLRACCCWADSAGCRACPEHPRTSASRMPRAGRPVAIDLRSRGHGGRPVAPFAFRSWAERWRSRELTACARYPEIKTFLVISRRRRRHDEVRLLLRRGKAEGSSVMRNLLGGKGCELAEMTNLGIPVPPGFTITTQAWAALQPAGRQLPEGLWEQVAGAPREARAGRRRSASAIPPAPARLGALGRARVDAGDDGDRPQPRPERRHGRGLAARTRNERFAWDCYRRFVTMFGDVVLGIGGRPSTSTSHALKTRWASPATPRCRPPSSAKLVHTYKEHRRHATGAPFPQDPREQLRLAIHAVFDSWFAKKATEYRRIHNIPTTGARR